MMIIPGRPQVPVSSELIVSWCMCHMLVLALYIYLNLTLSGRTTRFNDDLGIACCNLSVLFTCKKECFQWYHSFYSCYVFLFVVVFYCQIPARMVSTQKYLFIYTRISEIVRMFILLACKLFFYCSVTFCTKWKDATYFAYMHVIVYDKSSLIIIYS